MVGKQNGAIKLIMKLWLFTLLCFFPQLSITPSFGEIQFQLVEPFQFTGQDDYSSYFPVGDTNEKQLSDWLLAKIHSELSVNFPGIMLPRMKGSAREMKLDGPQDLIFIRCNISRAQLSTVRKAECVYEYIFALTGGIEFLKIDTGVVFFTKTSTDIAIKRMTKGEREFSKKEKDDFRGIFKDNARSLFKRLVEECKEEYIPHKTIVKTCLKLIEGKVVINKGREDGISVGEMFRSATNPQAFIIIAEISKNYSIAQVNGEDTAKITTGYAWENTGSNKVDLKGNLGAMVSLPITLQSDMIDQNFDVSSEVLQQWVHDELARKTNMTMLPPASNLTAQQRFVADRGSFSESMVTGSRLRPDFYIDPIVTIAQISQAKQGERYFLRLMVELVIRIVDARTGIISYMDSARDILLEEYEPGWRELSVDALFPKILKNSVVTLVAKLSREFNPRFIEGELTEKLEERFWLVIFDGARPGVGTILETYRPGVNIQNPDTGKVIGRLEEPLGRMKIVKADDRGLIAEELFSAKELLQKDLLKSKSGPEYHGSKILQFNKTKAYRISNNKKIPYEGFSKELMLLSSEQGAFQSYQNPVLVSGYRLSELKRTFEELKCHARFDLGASRHAMEKFSEPDIVSNSTIYIFPESVGKDRSRTLTFGVKVYSKDKKNGKKHKAKYILDRELTPAKSSKEVTVGQNPDDDKLSYVELMRVAVENCLNKISEDGGE